MKFLFLILVIFSSYAAKASDLDVLIARTSLALGDEYSKLASSYQKKVSNYLEENPGVDLGDIEDAPMEYQQSRNNYEKYLALALDEFEIVFCNNSCPSPLQSSGLEMQEKYNFLRREAFNKFEQLKMGSNNEGAVGKMSTIYAANSNFEEHILARLTRLIEAQQSLDAEARKLSSTLNDLQNAYVDLENEEIVGVNQAILNESNYSGDTQSQIASYQACISNETSEDNFEKEELTKSTSQLDTLKNNLTAHFDKIYSFTYENTAGQKVLTVNANAGWAQQDIGLVSSDRILITATGNWNLRGSVNIFNPSHFVIGKRTDPLTVAYVLNSKQVNNYASNALFSIMTDHFQPEFQALKKIEEDPKPAFNRIRNGLDCKPDGYMFSFSNSLSNGSSVGTSASVGVSFLVSASVSASSSSSIGQSVGTSGTYSLKLNTTSAPNFAVGALIGSFCEGNPADDSTCEMFFIGSGGIFDVPSSLGTKKLWLRGNDGGLIGENKGSIQVSVRKQTAFVNYWNQYISWFNDDCDEGGYNCGLGKVLENIAYTPNPYSVARAAFVKQFPEFPEEVKGLILEQINYFVEMKIAQKDVKAKELSRELHQTKIATCRDQLDNTKQKLETTRELLATYRRREQNVRTKEIILDTTREFYEGELSAINNVRNKNLERIRRYYYLATNAYNYLYLDNFNPDGQAQPYFEGDYYKNQVSILEDLVLEITTVNDLLNPNRGFVIYQLSPEEFKKLINPDYRLRKTNVKLDYNDFFCQGFNIENQGRVMIDKVGVLLDVDPAREHLFFKNTNSRNTQLQITHGLENKFFDFSGSPVEYWMPSQKRNIGAYSSRILADSQSDYLQLRESRYFERTSFRKTSFASSWQLDMLDPSIRIYESSDTNYSNPILQGVKLVIWFNSAELQGELNLNQCLAPAHNIEASVGSRSGADVSWSFPLTDRDFSSIQRFTVYRSLNPTFGFKAIGHLDKTECDTEGAEIDCSYNDNTVTEGTYYYQVRSSYLSAGEVGAYLDGIPSEVDSVILSRKI